MHAEIGRWSSGSAANHRLVSIQNQEQLGPRFPAISVLAVTYELMENSHVTNPIIIDLSWPSLQNPSTIKAMDYYNGVNVTR